MGQLLILVDSKKNLGILESGLENLKDLGIRFSLRVASALATPEHLQKILQDHHQDVSVVICVSSQVLPLASFVASHLTCPILTVPLGAEASSALAGLPMAVCVAEGLPVASLAIGEQGFCDAALLSAQILGLSDASLKAKLEQLRNIRGAQIMEADERLCISFEGG